MTSKRNVASFNFKFIQDTSNSYSLFEQIDDIPILSLFWTKLINFKWSTGIDVLLLCVQAMRCSHLCKKSWKSLTWKLQDFFRRYERRRTAPGSRRWPCLLFNNFLPTEGRKLKICISMTYTWNYKMLKYKIKQMNLSKDITKVHELLDNPSYVKATMTHQLGA